MQDGIVEKVEALQPWAEPFDFGGVKTLGPERYAKTQSRLRARQSIFIDPMKDAGFLEGKRILDLGCNAGHWSLLVLQEGARFVRGVDTDHQRLAQARFVMDYHGIGADRCDLIRTDVYEHLAKTDDRFDIVFCLGLFYHIEEPMRLMRLMQRVATSLVILDTMVSNVQQASISVRPCQRKERYLDTSNIGLEFVSSPKAIHWMALSAGFGGVEALEYRGELSSEMGGYRRGERRSFAIAQAGVRIGDIFPNVIPTNYLTPEQDHQKYGHYPEKRKIIRDDEAQSSLPVPPTLGRGRKGLRRMKKG